MKAEKRIKEIVDIEKKEITERNKEFYEEYLKKNYGATRARTFNFAKKLIGLATCLICLVVGVNVLVNYMLPRAQEPPLFQGGHDLREATLEQINALFDGYELNLDENIILSINCAYDKELKVDLFYSVKTENLETFEFIDIFVVVHKDYSGFHPLVGDIINYMIGDVSVEYVINKTDIDVEPNSIYSKAKLGDQEIIVKYSSIIGNGEDTFRAFMEKIIVDKN